MLTICEQTEDVTTVIHLAEGITWNGGEADAIGLQLALYSNAHKIKAGFSEETNSPVIGVLTF